MPIGETIRTVEVAVGPVTRTCVRLRGQHAVRRRRQQFERQRIVFVVMIVGQHVEQDGAVLVDLDDVVARQGRMVDAGLTRHLSAAGRHRFAIADLV